MDHMIWRTSILPPAEAFKKVTRLSQHIAFPQEDFFRSYKDFSDTQLDTIEILLMQAVRPVWHHRQHGLQQKETKRFPILADFYQLCEEEYQTYDKQAEIPVFSGAAPGGVSGRPLHVRWYGIQYFNGHTNIADDKFRALGSRALWTPTAGLKTPCCSTSSPYEQ